MKSPFPGMDPYLEARWSDVHVTLLGFVKEALQPKLPPDLRARSEERVLLETIEGDPIKRYVADVAVVDVGARSAGERAVAAAGVATVEPVLVRYEAGPILDRFIVIIDRTNGNRVVTAIEILSPWNKAAGRLNADYVAKLDDYARAGVSLVEIDLLRHPPRSRLLVHPEDLPADRRAPYLACVRRGWQPDLFEVYPLSLRRPLPAIPVPLRRADAEVMLELQPLIDRIYAAGGHDDIDYARPCMPPLEGDDADWADRLLRDAGRR